MGAIQATHKSDIREYKQLRNLVEEMSVAAAVTAPDCFVIAQDISINAFVAGNNQHTVLVVTQGALDKLNHDELRAVVSHELAHVANSDLALSMKLLIALGGLNAISAAGRKCFSSTKLYSHTGASRDFTSLRINGHNEGVLAALLAVVMAVSFAVGTFLYILGSVFVFFGVLLKAAFLRKRELLADAKAVQFTRDTWSMASALNKIAENETQKRLHTRLASDVAHMCIDSPAGNALFLNWLATHPPLQTRINSIDPHFRVKHRKKSDAANGNADNPTTGAARTVIQPDAALSLSSKTLNELGPELSIVLSLVIQTSGYKTETNIKKYENTLRCYTSEPLPMRLASEPGINEQLNDALTALMHVPALQRQNLLDHLAELVDHDGIQLKEESDMLSLVYDKLNPKDSMN